MGRGVATKLEGPATAASPLESSNIGGHSGQSDDSVPIVKKTFRYDFVCWGRENHECWRRVTSNKPRSPRCCIM